MPYVPQIEPSTPESPPFPCVFPLQGVDGGYVVPQRYQPPLPTTFVEYGYAPDGRVNAIYTRRTPRLHWKRADWLVRGSSVFLPVPPVGTWTATDWQIQVTVTVHGGDGGDLSLQVDGAPIGSMSAMSPSGESGGVTWHAYDYDAEHDLSAGGLLRLAVSGYPRTAGGSLSLTPLP